MLCVDRKVPELGQTVDQISANGGKAVAVVADVAKPADADRMVSECVRHFGKLDLALNAAGVMDGTDPAAPPDFDKQKPLLPAAIHEATDDYWHIVFANNVTSMFLSMRAELRQDGVLSQQAEDRGDCALTGERARTLARPVCERSMRPCWGC